ncbi:polysaccharide biosynthesis protein [Desulfurococcaceae archaeon MEX13E-LK6-19]|nr:polysaccharide biosynthesis protein [Desulfurococcaceae archaeon MEX13E-LK6-19]
MDRKEVYIVASGGGHTGYAKAIAERIIELWGEEVQIVFIIPRNDKWSYWRLKKIKSSNTRVVQVLKPRGPHDPLYKSLGRIVYAFIDAYVKKTYKNVVVTTGSNHSLVVALAACLKKTRVLNMEVVDRIITASTTPRILYKIGFPTILHWQEQKRSYPKGVVVGPIYEKPVYKPFRGGYILVTTGTMGHELLFKKLLETDLENVVIQTGRVNPSYFTRIKKKWRVFRFDPDIDRWIAGADVVVTHQGLTAVNAALAYGKPVIIAYNPGLPRTSTILDSIFLAKKINGVTIDPRKISSKELEELILKARKLRPPKYVDGAYVFVKRILSEFIE